MKKQHFQKHRSDSVNVADNYHNSYLGKDLTKRSPRKNSAKKSPRGGIIGGVVSIDEISESSNS